MLYTLIIGSGAVKSLFIVNVSWIIYGGSMDRPKLALVLFINTVFLLFFISALFGLSGLRVVTAGMIVTFVPGLGWALRFLPGKSDNIIKGLAAFLITVFTVLTGLVIFKVSGAELNSVFFAAGLFVFSNAGLLFLKKVNRAVLDKYQLMVFAAALLLIGTISAKIPLVYDGDIHFIAPAYGIVKELKPYKDFSRVPYVIDHPAGPLLLSATTVFLSGQADKTKEVYLSAKEIEKSCPSERVWELWPEISELSEPRAEIIFSRYPKLIFAARIPHVLLGSFLLVMLFEAVRKRTGSVFLGSFAAAMFLGPEMVVRLSYAHYTAAILFALMAIYYVCTHVRKNILWLFILGFIAAWINQKTLILPLALLISDLYRCRGRVERGTAGCLVGWILGTATVAVYGYYLNWGCFIRSFIISHGSDVFLLDPKNFMGFLASWTKAVLYMNPIIFIAVLSALFYCLIKDRKTRFLVSPVWFLVGFGVFITAPWPITRNCDLVYPPMFMALGVFLSTRRQMTRRVMVILFAVLFCFNYLVMYRTFKAPTSFYGYNESFDTSGTVTNRYFDSVQRMFRGKEGLEGQALVDYWSEPMESRLPQAVARHYYMSEVYRQQGEEQQAYEAKRKVKSLM
ncbi:MAG: hypothetical protein P9L88_06085 [Candidatus Tantalella remota]|nr:hypothetical protein [Candidatus Tantalella remota]